MGLEHISGEVERPPVREDPEPRVGDFESERPQEIELPNFENSVIDMGDLSEQLDEWDSDMPRVLDYDEMEEVKPDDSERESVELPHIEPEDTSDKNNDADDSPEKGKPIQNKLDGLEREHEVEKELEEQYPPEEGYSIISEAYLRDENGNIVKDPETGQARRIDFVVVKDGKVVDSVEVTSKTADKSEQTAKENRIRENGGNYIKDNDGNLIRIPDNVTTRIERRD